VEKEKIWTKSFIIVSLINFLVVLMYYLLIVTIAAYATSKYGASTSMAGLVSSIFIIGSLIGRLFAGRYISTLGSKKVLWTGIVSFLITSCLYIIEGGLVFLILTRLLQGIAVGIVGTASGTVIAQIVPSSRKGEGIGYFSLSNILATAIGPFIGIWLMGLSNGYSLMFTINIIFSIVCIIIIFFAKFEAPKLEHVQQTGSILSRFIEPGALPISFVACIVGFAYSGVMSFLHFYAEENQLMDAAQFFFLIYALVIIASRPFTGKLFDKRGANIIVYPCLLLFTLGMLIFSKANHGWMLLASAALIGIGFGNFNTIAQSVAVKVTPAHRYGLATSTFFIMYDIGLGVGPYILGTFVPDYGYRHIFTAMSIVAALCIPIYLGLHGRKEHRGMRA